MVKNYIPSTQIGSITERILTGKGSHRTFNFTCFPYALRTTEAVVTLTPAIAIGGFSGVLRFDMRILLTSVLELKKIK